MADNFEANAGSGGNQYGSDDIAGIHYPRCKIIVGADGTNNGDVAKGNPLPVGANTVKDGSGTVYALLCDSDGNLQVDVISAPSTAVTNVGTFLVQENGAALTALQLLDNIVLAEDAAHQTGDPGVQALAVRQDADAAFGADGDYSPLQLDDNGFLKVNIKAGAGSGGTASTDDAAFTAASGSGTPMMGFVTSDSVDSGDVGVVGMLANRQLKVTLYDSAGAELAVGGGTQYTEDAAAAANPIGNALIAIRDDARGGSLTSADGDNVALRGTNAGELYVKHVDNVTVAGTGTFSVQASAIVPGTGATNLGKAEDAAHASGDTGVMALAVRKATPADVSGTDGDYEPLQVNAGRLWVSAIVDTALPAGANTIGAVTQSGTWNVGTVTAVTTVTTVTTCSTLTTITNAVKSVGNTAHDAALSDAPVAIGGYGSDTAPTAVSAAGDAVRGWFGLKGMQFVALAGVDGTHVGVLGTGALKVGGDHHVVDDAAFTPGGNDVVMGGFTYIAAGDSVQDGDAGAGRMSANRCQFVNIRDNAGNERGLNIDASGQLAVTLASAQTLGTVTTVTTVSTLTGGGIAHDAADSGNPHKIGMKATGAMTARTLVAADDRTDLFAGLDGVAIVRPHAPLEDLLSDRATNTDGASTAMAGGFAAPGANIRLYLTTLIIANSSATAVTVDIRDGAAGSVLLTVPVPADTGGVVVNLPVPLKFTANTALAYDASAAVTTLTISVLGFKSKAG